MNRRGGNNNGFNASTGNNVGSGSGFSSNRGRGRGMNQGFGQSGENQTNFNSFGRGGFGSGSGFGQSNSAYNETGSNNFGSSRGFASTRGSRGGFGQTTQSGSSNGFGGSNSQTGFGNGQENSSGFASTRGNFGGRGRGMNQGFGQSGENQPNFNRFRRGGFAGSSGFDQSNSAYNETGSNDFGAIRGFASSRGSRGGFGSSHGNHRVQPYPSRGGSSAPKQNSGKDKLMNNYLNFEIAPLIDEQQLVLNCYNIELSSNEVHQYELIFSSEFADGAIQDLSINPSRSVDKGLRRECITKCYEILRFRENESYFKPAKEDRRDYQHIFAYDRSSIFYSSLLMRSREGDNRFEINTEHLSTEIYGYLRKPQRIFATLKFTKTLKLNMEAPKEELSQFLNILFTQNQLDMPDRFIKIQSKMFDLQSGHDITAGAELKIGHQKSIKFIDNTAVLQIDAVFSPFHKVMELHHYVFEKWGFGPNDDWLSSNIQHVLLNLRELFVQTTHKDNKEIFQICGITKMSAEKVTFLFNGLQTSVAAYFQNFYKKKLEYPELPCIIKRIGNNEVFYPFEYLKIIKGQKISLDYLNKQQEWEMNQAAQRLPFHLLGDIENQKQLAGIHNDDPNILATNIRISPLMNSVNSTVLKPPVIIYKDNTAKNVIKGQWNSDEVNFVKPVEINSLAVLFDVKKVSKEEAMQMVNRIGPLAYKLGMKIVSKTYIPLYENQINNYEHLERIITEFRDKSKKRVFVLGFAEGSEFHDTLKATEGSTHVPTQQLEPTTIKSKKLGRSAIKSIIQKMNEKNGGFNHYFRQAVPSQIGDEYVDNFLKYMEETIIMGFSMSHPPSGDKNGQPSVCGYAFSANKRGNIARGGFVYTKAGSKILTGIQLQEPFEKAANLYFEENKCYPKRVLIYRSAVSDGEIQKIKAEESKAMADTLLAAMKGNNVKLNVVIVYKQHNTHLFKQPNAIKAKDKVAEQNVLPGTCAKGFTSADSTVDDIIIVPHCTVQGTVKPTIFSNIFPDSELNDVPEDFLKNITYAFCHMHEICESAIRIPHALRSAEQTAHRGKKLWQTRIHQLQLPPPNHEEYFSQATTLLNPEIPTCYWA